MRRTPRLEPLEARDLPSAASWIAASQARIATTVGSATPADTTPTGTPSPHELKRETFVAKLTGTYLTGPPQFSDESMRVSFTLPRGGTNRTLHVQGLVAINVALDPNRPTTRATATIFSRNTSTTGTTLTLDLVAPPRGASTRPPTHLTWTINGSSGGLYTNATSPGPGTLDITSLPSKVGRGPNEFESGRAILVFKGLIATTGTGNLLQLP